MSEPVRSGLVQFHPDLTPLLTAIDNVAQHPENPNNGDIEAIAESIEISGMYRPIYVQRTTGYIIAGNHTWEACKTLGATEIPVVYLDLDDTAAVRIMLADNQIASLARPDTGALVVLLDRLVETDSLLGTGFAEHDLTALRALSEIPPNLGDFAQWPTICVRVPPTTKAAYLDMTEIAVGDRERFELLLKLAGWDGKAP